MSVDVKNLQPGDIISIHIIDDDNLSYAKTATVIGINPFGTIGSRVLVALDSPYQGINAISHNEIWEIPQFANNARLFGIPYQTNISWWIDQNTIINKIITPAPKELPCILCKRKNFLDASSCWWCGHYPFNK